MNQILEQIQRRFSAFERVSPRWHGVFAENEGKKAEGMHREALVDGATCVVGEGHGGSSKYYTGSYDERCIACQDYCKDIYAYAVNVGFDAASEYAEKFAMHFEAVHA